MTVAGVFMAATVAVQERTFQEMKYYLIDPETKERVELVGRTDFADRWWWSADPRSVRENELVYDEEGTCHNLKDLL